MKEIKLAKIELINFKGIREMTLNFSYPHTTIGGENGTGKTTIFDAFMWLLFGKDSQGMSDSSFAIKTHDMDGNVLLRLEHSVTGYLDVNGSPVKLCRKYLEKWTKPRGTAEEVLSGHYTDFYVNDVKCGTKREYDEQVAEILSEDVSRIITDPYYFVSLKPETQKDMLLDMAGNVTNEEIGEIKPEFAQLLADLSGKSLQQYTRELAAQKRAAKLELQTIPASIDTAMRCRPEEDNWEEIEQSIADTTKEIADIDKQLSDHSLAVKDGNDKKIALEKEIGAKEMALTKLINNKVAADRREEREALDSLRAKQDRLKQLERDKEFQEKSLADLENNISEHENSLTKLRQAFATISQETITFRDGEFCCPTCKRELDPEDIEAKRNELIANFNLNKAKRLEENKHQGMAKKSELEKLSGEEKQAILDKIANIDSAIMQQKEIIEQHPKNMRVPRNEQDFRTYDKECIDLQNEITDLRNQQSLLADVSSDDFDDTSLKAKKSALNAQLQTLYNRQSNKSLIDKVNKEIEMLELKRKANSQKLADLENKEFIAMDFQKTKDATLLNKINSMFSYCNFSFIDEQLNGGEKLTCKCLIKGTEYKDANHASKLNAGLDIINAICKSKGICAPIFIDNRESVNTIIPTLAQVINLKVTDSELLQIIQ